MSLDGDGEDPLAEGETSEARAEHIRELAFQLFAAEQPLGAAIFYVQSLRHAEKATAWSELGCALQDCAGTFVRSPFFESAEVAFRRAEHLGLEGPMVPVIAERRQRAAGELGRHHPGVSKVNAGADRFLALAQPTSIPREALDSLEAFLVVSDNVVAEAIGALPDPDRGRALALCAELGWTHLARAVELARAGRWGEAQAEQARRLALPASLQTLPVPPDPHAVPSGAPASVPPREGGQPQWLSLAVGLALLVAGLVGAWFMAQ